uniref:Peptidase n=1 Tax=viral metagenome TaxID=1070528 RepID=A0A6M3LPV0_9ZZZZ
MSINWKHVRYFKPEEFDDPKYPGSGENISGVLLNMLIRMRLQTISLDEPKGWPVIIHTSVGGAVDVDGSWGHAGNSYHLFVNGCKAVDFHFATKSTLREQFFLVSGIGFGGVGIYYDWNTKGFHVDVRPKKETQRWKRESGKYFYLLS